jgi:hypothetical protein
MQKVTSLEDVLGAGVMQPQRARRLARQIAQELCASHQGGLSHGPLNAAHIMLVGSGQEERAVITGFGIDTNLQADLRDFGQLLDLLLPGHRLASDCAASSPAERPDTFELVVEELQDFSLCRTWIGSLLIGAAAASLFLYQLAHAHTSLSVN